MISTSVVNDLMIVKEIFDWKFLYISYTRKFRMTSWQIVYFFLGQGPIWSPLPYSCLPNPKKSYTCTHTPTTWGSKTFNH